MIFASRATVTCDIEKLFSTRFSSYILQQLSSEISLSSKILQWDVLARVAMKNAAKCDTQCELQNSVNHQIFERNARILETSSLQFTGVFNSSSVTAVRFVDLRAAACVSSLLGTSNASEALASCELNQSSQL